MKAWLILVGILLSGCSPSPPPDAKIIAYFQRHERQLTQLLSLGEKHPTLRRAEPSLAKYADFNGRPSDDDRKAQEEAYRILKEIDADFIEWWREPDGRIFQVSVPFYRWGLGLGGYSKGLEYIPDYRKEPPRSEEKRKYRQIADTAWFIEESDTR